MVQVLELTVEEYVSAVQATQPRVTGLPATQGRWRWSWGEGVRGID